MRGMRAIALIESVLFVVIALSMLIGSVIFYRQTSEASRVNDAVRSIVSIQSGLRSLYQTSDSFGAVSGMDLVPVVLASGSVPDNLHRQDGTIANQWGGQILVTGYQGAFVVDFQDVPLAACVRMAPHSATGNGPAGQGIAAVAINGVMADVNLDGEVSAQEAAEACGLPVEVAAMKWAFMPSMAMSIDVAELEAIMGIGGELPSDPGNPDQENPAPVTEIGRVPEVETIACGPGHSGQQTRSRDLITYSDGSTQSGEWSDYDRSLCEALTITGTSTESQNQSCPVGQYGTRQQTRTVTTWSDGSITFADWVTTSDCKYGTDVKGHYTYSTLNTSTSGCSATQFKSWYVRHGVVVYYDGTVERDYDKYTTNKGNCKTTGTGFNYRDCTKTRYGRESMSLSLKRSGSSVVQTSTSGWNDVGCFN